MKLSHRSALYACIPVALPTGMRNQWKRDTKGTHRRGIPAQTSPYRGSIRQDRRNKRSLPICASNALPIPA